MTGVDLEVDVLVVGAGPVGLFAAYYAGFRDLSVAVVDSLPEVGGQITAMYPEKAIRDVAGFPSVLGRELVAALAAQADPFSPKYLLGEQARTLDYAADGSALVGTDRGRTVRAGAVVITGGIGTFTPRPLPAADGFEGRGLRYFVREPAELAGRHVIVVGGGDSALDWAATLEPLARSVTLVHRRKAFRAHEQTVRQVLASSVEVLTGARVTAVHSAEDGSMAAVDVSGDDGEVFRRPAQDLVAALGFTADLGPLLDWQLTVVDRHLTVDTRMATNRPRVYAAGDIATYPGKVRLIAVGFGEAATAVNNAATVLDSDAPLFPGHSTDE